MTVEKHSIVDRSLAERRRYRREQIAVPGRQFEPADNREAACKIVDLSPGGAHVLSENVPAAGSHVDDDGARADQLHDVDGRVSDR